MLMRMKKTDGGLHHHSSTYDLVVLEGQMKHLGEGEKAAEAPPLGPGSYWHEPGLQPHDVSCLTDECLMFIKWEGKRDAILANHRNSSATVNRSGRPGKTLAAVALGTVLVACHQRDRDPVPVNNPDHVLLRSLSRRPMPSTRCGHHRTRAPVRRLRPQFPFSISTRSFLPTCDSKARQDLAGGVGIWLPLTPEASRRLERGTRDRLASGRGCS